MQCLLTKTLFSPIIQSAFDEVQSQLGFAIADVQHCFLAGGTCNLDQINTFILSLLPHIKVTYLQMHL